MLETELFEHFPNNDEITEKIKDVLPSAPTLQDRAVKMAKEIKWKDIGNLEYGDNLVFKTWSELARTLSLCNKTVVVRVFTRFDASL